jgi:Predicted enzyme related to lactoylglutathione lyase
MNYRTLSPNIGVKSVDETVCFYTETLGFNLLASVPSAEGKGLQWAMVAHGEVILMFQEIGNLKEEYPELADRPLLGALTFYVKMKNMHELYEKLKDTEYLAHDMNKTFYGADEFAIMDNNGHILTITEDKQESEAIKNYDNFFLPVESIPESVHFYADILGLEKKFEFPEQGMVAFKVGSEEPAIILKDRTKIPGALPTIWMEVEDVVSVYEKLKEKGLRFLSTPFRIKTGWAVEFSDPTGNRLGFTDYKKE